MIKQILKNKKQYLDLLLLADDHPIFEGGVLLIDMVYLKMKL